MFIRVPRVSAQPVTRTSAVRKQETVVERTRARAAGEASAYEEEHRPASRLKALRKTAGNPDPGKLPELRREADALREDLLREPDSALTRALLAEVGKLRERLAGAELTAGSVSATGVTVARVRQPAQVEIRDSAGVMVGSGNRQVNKIHVRLGVPEVSVRELLTGTPAQQRALANLLRKPDGWLANHAVRRHLGAFAEQADRGTLVRARTETRTGGREDGGATVRIRRSQGVVVGDGNVQNNHFHYRIERPEALMITISRCECRSISPTIAPISTVTGSPNRLQRKALRNASPVEVHGPAISAV